MKLKGNHCQCKGCEEYFNSLTAFDMHRVGDWQERGAHRRCLTVAQMRARGMAINRAGFWVTKPFAGHPGTAIGGDLAQAIPEAGVGAP